MALTKRVQVLMEPSEFQRLEAISRDQGLAVGEILRRAARQQYTLGNTARVEAATAIAALDLPGAGEVASVIASARQPATP